MHRLLSLGGMGCIVTLKCASRIVDISAAAANAPSEAAPSQATPAPAPAPAAFSVSALPLLSPTDALAAALRGQDIPTSRQLTPNEVLPAVSLAWHLFTHALGGMGVTVMPPIVHRRGAVRAVW